MVLATTALGLFAPYAHSSTHNWQSYSQIRYTQYEDKGGYLSLRRLKLFGRGPISGDRTYYLQFLYRANTNSSTDDHVIVQEANVLVPLKSAKLTIGQFKPPFGMERFTSDYQLDLIDRSQPTERLIPNGSLGLSSARARGVQLERQISKTTAFAVGIFDGNGANEPFDGNGPLAVGRLVYRRQQGEARRIRSDLAFSWRKDHDIDFLGQLPGAPPGYVNFAGRDIRENLALAYDAGANAFRAEFIASQYDSDKPGLPSIDAWGYYIQWAHTFSEHWTVAARLETLDSDQSTSDSKDASWLTIGATYNIDSNHQRVQVNYVLKNEEADEFDNNTLVVQYQKFF